MNVTLSTSYGDFEWDSKKEAANRRKHGLGFALAAEVFADEHGVYIQDDEHSFGEERQRLLGQVHGTVLLLVVFTERGSTRIISARRARQCSHEMEAHKKIHLIWMAARNDAVFFAYLVAMPRHCFKCRNAFSTRCRAL